MKKPLSAPVFLVLMFAASGWQASPENLGVVNVFPTDKNSPGLHFKFEGNGNAAGTAEGAIISMISGYNGSPMRSATIDGVEFKTMTYTHGGRTQPVHAAFRNVTRITITMEGVGAKDLSKIKAVLPTVLFKQVRFL